jgi:hypothetical protein
MNGKRFGLPGHLDGFTASGAITYFGETQRLKGGGKD